jgi:protein ImuB
MSIAQAGELVHKASGTAAILQPHDRSLDEEAMTRIAVRVQQQLTPLVAIETLDPKPWAGHPRHQSESLLGDISGVTHLFGGEAGLLRAADQLLAAIGLRARMAIADSLGAAWALAHYGRTEEPRDWKAGPGEGRAGSLHLIAPAGSLRPQLEPLAVESLRLSPETVATLGRLGVTRVGQLLRLPRSGLAPRLGNQLVDRIAQALGEVDEPLAVHRPPAEHRQTHLLQYPTADQAILADRVQRLIEKISDGLAKCQRGALRMTCRLDLTAHSPLTFEIGLFAPTNAADHLGGLITNRLESKKLPATVERLTLDVTLSGPLRSVQPSLFERPHLGADSSFRGEPSPTLVSGSGLSRLIDSLSGRLGRNAVLGVRMEENPLPEKAFTTWPLAGSGLQPHGSRASSKSKRQPSRKPSSTAATRARMPKTGWLSDGARSDSAGAASSSNHHERLLHPPSPRDPLRRPLSLLARPVPLAVAFGNGPFHHEVSSPQLPARLRLGGAVHLITAHWGPERIETGWWHGPSIRRDYYRIETNQGRWWWIFRDLHPQFPSSNSKTPASNGTPPTQPRYRWMLHGRFD